MNKHVLVFFVCKLLQVQQVLITLHCLDTLLKIIPD